MKIREAIPDAGLRMGTLNFLLEAEAIDPAALDAALTPAVAAIQAQDDYWDEDQSGERQLVVEECDEELLQHGLDALGEIEVTAAQLASVTALDFDGGNEIYMWFEAALAERLGLEDWELDTGGESELYLVRSFAGLEALTGLESLDLDAYGWVDAVRDARPLAGLTKLRELNLMNAALANPEVLVELASLAKVTNAGGLPAAIREALASDGVTVEG